MHILFLADNFPPEVNAPASRTYEHAREWVRSGHKVTVITCAPNFPKGQVFAGYRNLLRQTEQMDRIEVVRVWSYITANEGLARRVLDYMSFMLMATLMSFWVRKVDVVIGTSPQFFTACAAQAVSTLKGVPWVFELRDIWPESIKVVGAMRESWIIRLLERIELFLYRHATKVITVTHTFKKILISRGICANKIEVVTNGVDLSHFGPMEKDRALVQELGLEGCFVAGYIGTHGLAHGLETLLDAAQMLQETPGAQSVRLLFLGDGAKKSELQDSARRRQLHNVIFLNSVPKDQVARYWSLLDVSVIHLRKAELFGSVIPSKLFECMGMGIPVLHGVAGESADIVRAEQVGEVFESDNAVQLVECLLSLRQDVERYRRYKASCLVAAKNYDRTHLARRMQGILEGMNS